jgi:hypothetical protein
MRAAPLSSVRVVFLVFLVFPVFLVFRVALALATVKVRPDHVGALAPGYSRRREHRATAPIYHLDYYTHVAAKLRGGGTHVRGNTSWAPCECTSATA